MLRWVVLALTAVTGFTLTQALARNLADATRLHALVYATNTAGAFAGAIATGFALIHWLGLAGVLYAMGLVYIAAGAVFAGPVRARFLVGCAGVVSELRAGDPVRRVRVQLRRSTDHLDPARADQARPRRLGFDDGVPGRAGVRDLLRDARHSDRPARRPLGAAHDHRDRSGAVERNDRGFGARAELHAD